MKILFRADASHRIGSGHVMRCLTLARFLRQRGHEVFFFSRPHPGHLNESIRKSGITLLEPAHPCHEMDRIDPENGSENKYEAWLGTSRAIDAADTAAAIRNYGPLDWIVVDHYSLDVEWESAMRPCTRHLAVLDDLANRRHDADLLIDPVPGREVNEYRPLLPANATILPGPAYAPLRPEFPQLRDTSLAHRQNGNRKPRRLLINMGGSDPDGATLTVLSGLNTATLPRDMEMEIILGSGVTAIDEIRHAAENLPYRTGIVIDAADIAMRMQRADLAIGAAGTTSWERCCLGLPAIIITIAENQKRIAAALEREGAILWLGDLEKVIDSPDIVGRAVTGIINNPRQLSTMSRSASMICDGQGASRVADALHDRDQQ